MPRDSAVGAESATENERFTVTLIVAAVRALGRIMRLTGHSKTDAINRSVQVYAFVLEQTAQDKELMLRGMDGTLEKVHVL
ncbi:hypothetical protein [Streptomyces sp. NBC_00829]|uniref:hypothetical protein n=1 Tax=Streptomyces sp. NBC_00829 TaxID=2903679 RepID=UPI00386CBDEB|nr:hypothetical protein OG293_08825 [Streptomyces sp. NBC_00829]